VGVTGVLAGVYREAMGFVQLTVGKISLSGVWIAQAFWQALTEKLWALYNSLLAKPA
jgi:hypothetical protein